MMGVSSPGKSYLVSEFAHFHFDEVQQFFVVHHVALVQEHDDGHAHLASQQDVSRVWGMGPSAAEHDQDGAVHLGGAGDHVLHIVGVAGAVHVGVFSGWPFRIQRAAVLMVMPRAFSSGAASIWSRSPWRRRQTADSTVAIAAVSVILPWSTWPMVPTLAWGFESFKFL